MFKSLIFVAGICLALGLPVDQNVVSGDQPYVHHPVVVVPIVSEVFENNGDGSFHFGYESGDGTKVQEEGALRVYDENTAEEAVRGSYEYVSPEGKNIKVDYIADGTGFHVFSDDIPKSADVSSLSQYTTYSEQYQGVQQPQLATRFVSEKSNVASVPVVHHQQQIVGVQQQPQINTKSYVVEKSNIATVPVVQQQQQFVGVQQQPQINTRSYVVEKTNVATVPVVQHTQQVVGVQQPIVKTRAYVVGGQKTNFVSVPVVQNQQYVVQEPQLYRSNVIVPVQQYQPQITSRTVVVPVTQEVQGVQSFQGVQPFQRVQRVQFQPTYGRSLAVDGEKTEGQTQNKYESVQNNNVNENNTNVAN